MRNISTVVRGHYDDDRYMWAIIIRRFYDTKVPDSINTTFILYDTTLILRERLE
jgi:hypothetical protein